MTDIHSRIDTTAVVRYDSAPAVRISDADRNGTLRMLHNAVALGLIDIGEFEERSARVALARQPADLECLVEDLPRAGAIASSSADRLELRGWMGSLRRHGEWTVPTRLSLVRRMGSVDLDLTTARFAGPVVMIELDLHPRVAGPATARRCQRLARRRHRLRRQRPRPPQEPAGRGQTPCRADRPGDDGLGEHPRPAPAGAAGAEGASEAMRNRA